MNGVRYSVEYEAHHLVMVWVGDGVWDSDELGEQGVFDGFQSLYEGVDVIPPLLRICG